MPPPAESPPPIGTRDLRVTSLRPLLSPALLLEDLPLDQPGSRTVSCTREEVVRILDREDDRLVVVVGPCSVHDCRAALEYAQRLAAIAGRLTDDLRLIMRVYFEKPRVARGGLFSQLSVSWRTHASDVRSRHAQELGADPGDRNRNVARRRRAGAPHDHLDRR
jgi:hypothetical protein